MDNFIGSLRNFGIVEGIALYFKLKNFQIDSIKTSKLKHKVHLRPGSVDNCVFKQIFLKQDLNIPILEAFVPTTIIDLGANIGMSSLYLANRFPEAEIIGVEPDEDNGRMFNKNLKYFPNVSLELAAVRGDHHKVEMRDYGRGESGYIAEESENGTPAITITDILVRTGWERIDVLKIDIEGSEKSVFEKNYEDWLPKTKIMFVELHERKVPGCKEVLRKALDNYNFRWSKSGEYEVLINQDLL